MKRAATIAAAGIGGVVMLGALAAWAVGLKTVDAGAEAEAPSTVEALYAGWGALLDEHVAAEGVDYPGLARDAAQLRTFAATLAEVGPRSTPALFPTEQDRLAYNINAYNALTLLGVVEHHPITTIHEVRGAFEPTAGFGFFWALRFRLDGRGINLYDLENKVIRPEFGDARIHAAINCASGSCPTLQARPFLPSTLDAQLDAATAEFVGSDRHVRYADGVVHLSSIFTWFRGDFEAHAERLGLPADTMAFVEHYTADAARKELAASARAQGWELRFLNYDWSLNQRP